MVSMYYPENRQSNRLYDGQYHNIEPISLSVFNYQGRELFLMDYYDANYDVHAISFLAIVNGRFHKLPIEKYPDEEFYNRTTFREVDMERYGITDGSVIQSASLGVFANLPRAVASLEQEQINSAVAEAIPSSFASPPSSIGSPPSPINPDPPKSRKPSKAVIYDVEGYARYPVEGVKPQHPVANCIALANPETMSIDVCRCDVEEKEGRFTVFYGDLLFGELHELVEGHQCNNLEEYNSLCQRMMSGNYRIPESLSGVIYNMNWFTDDYHNSFENRVGLIDEFKDKRFVPFATSNYFDVNNQRHNENVIEDYKDFIADGVIFNVEQKEKSLQSQTKK